MTGTAADFHKFHVALACGGTGANGYQLLSPASVELLMANSLPGGLTVGDLAAPLAAGITPNAGFGLGGYSTVATAGSPGLMSAGSYGWDGAAGTKAMWDTKVGLGFVFYTQLEFRATAACDDFSGAITAQVYGAVAAAVPRWGRRQLQQLDSSLRDRDDEVQRDGGRHVRRGAARL
jgi:CubicO group peptidase (beta-lactamase class C family)